MRNKLRTTREINIELRRLTEAATLERAFHLAHSIYRHREGARKVALEILWEALRGAGVRLVAQGEADRHGPLKPTKVRWDVVQWLQLLIYCKSESYEKLQEVNDIDSLTEEDMIIRYLKHLILITCRRNSFYVSLGLGRLLYNYSAGETIAIYDFIFQDPDSSTKKADAYYRGRKNKLIGELKKRFHDFVEINQGPRGEKRFRPQDDSRPFTGLVVGYLRRFTPWGTSCELPDRLDTWAHVNSLQSSQLSQIHSLIHPSCFSKITGALKLAPPTARLAVPRFFLTASKGGDTPPPDDEVPPPGLGEEEIAALRRRLAGEDDRRKKFIPQSLSVLADGVEITRLDLAESSRIRFEVGEDITLIEIIGHDEKAELLLATHMLALEEDGEAEDRPKVYSIVLKGGQTISLIISPEIISPTQTGDSEVSKASVELSYRETDLATAAAPWWRRIRRRAVRSKGSARLVYIPALSFKLAIVLGALAAAGLTLLIALRSHPAGPQQIARQQTPPPISEEGAPAKSSPETAQQTDSKPERTPPPAIKSERPSRPVVKRAPTGSTQAKSTTRGPRDGTVKSVLDVRRVYIESLGEDAFSRTVRLKLIEKLRTVDRFVITESPDEADTAITGTALPRGKGRREGNDQDGDVGDVTVELLNVSGEVIWRAGKYRGTAGQLGTQLAEALLEAIGREERRRRKND